MLPKIQDASIVIEEGMYALSSGIELFCKTLSKKDTSGKKAIYIHGGGSGGNHTIVERPSLWMIQKGIFSQVIMPDRRGAGKSASITKMMTYEDNAKDMKELLDSMNIQGKVTVIGVSYGGPIALTLAFIDPRIDEVILMSSSPSLKPAKGIMGYLYKHQKLEAIVGSVYSKMVGKLPSAVADFDPIYDAKGIGQLKQIFLDAIKRTPRDRLASLLYENASTCNLENQAISPQIRLDIPIFRVIGTKDETWEVSLGDTYQSRLPNLKTTYIEGAGHKDIFFRAEEFYNALKSLVSSPL